jgi:UDP-N-acetylglucosamine:LPS N-acetylglucosamine transferase
VKTVDLVYFNAGGGHRAAAQALEQSMVGRPWRVRLINLTEILDPDRLFRKLTGVEPEDLYNRHLAGSLTFGLPQQLKIVQGLIKFCHNTMMQRMRVYWQKAVPDLVVSLIPNFNRALCESLISVRPGVPYVTVLTDMADHPPNFWIEPDLKHQHIVCGTAYAANQALLAGCASERVHLASGMILRPAFYESPPMDRHAERCALGLDPAQATGLVLFGGRGTQAMHRIAQLLPDVPLILMCGHNISLARALRALPSSAPRVVLDFTPDVARWMRLADFFIGKPGPGSMSEAVHSGLPLVVMRSAKTMPQERWNTEWVKEHQVGVVYDSYQTLRAAVEETLSRLPELRVNVRRVRNRAVFEVPEILARLMADVDASDRPHSAPQVLSLT